MQKKWLILLIVSSFAGFCTFVYLATAYYKIFKGEPYYQSIAAIQSHPEVIEALGSPIEPSWFFSGNYFYNTLVMNFDIHGADTNGQAFIHASKKNDAWTLDSVWVIPKNTDDFIIVLEPEPISSSGNCNAPIDDYAMPDYPTEEGELNLEPESTHGRFGE